MSGQSNARDHLDNFSWWVGRADVSDREANLMDLAILKEELDDMISMRARNAVEMHGLTWAQVGRALGISRQAASQRFGYRK
ncbi:hypothetical protein COCCU_14615 (plasmid) [Corynebacterium occultum]|uniref:Sigma-70, region 4 n=1 Tax=Corynebacterium occultum TaxID=2675219 RepID=A0A6B8VXG0_9CORY|nr:hypothetical protein [Corynebacterium occultum]QGU08813.1 hypothetical protein COCCU_14615 [Corynebacterium occultum]